MGQELQLVFIGSLDLLFDLRLDALGIMCALGHLALLHGSPVSYLVLLPSSAFLLGRGVS